MVPRAERVLGKGSTCPLSFRFMIIPSVGILDNRWSLLPYRHNGGVQGIFSLEDVRRVVLRQLLHFDIFLFLAGDL